MIELHSIELSKILTIKRNGFHIDQVTIQAILEETANIETPEQRQERLQKQVDKRKAEKCKNFLAQTAKECSLK